MGDVASGSITLKNYGGNEIGEDFWAKILND